MMRKSNVEKCYFDKILTEHIEKLCKETNTTLDTALLSVLMAVNTRHTRQDTVTAKVIKKDGNFHFVKGAPDENLTYEQFLLELKLQENALLNDGEKIDFYLYMQSEIVEEQYDLDEGISVVITKENGKWNMEWFYSSKYYQMEEVSYYINHVLIFLETVLMERTKPLKDVLLLSEKEEKLVLKTFNQTYTEYNRDETIIDLFEKQVEKYPNHTALIFKNQTVTYLEMNEKVNGLALHLRKMGVKPNDFVMIRAERSVELILAIYGVLKAGGAYISVTSSFPEERVNYMIQDCKPRCILTYGQKEIESTENSDIPVVDLSDSKIYEGGQNNPVRVTKMEDICYVIYTSGTTGNPKGVVIKHQGLRNLAASYRDIFRLTDKDVVLQFSSTSFDLSVSDIFSIVTSGAALCILPEEYVRDIEKLEEYMNEKGVTSASLTPMLIKELHSDKLPKLRILDCGGEAGNLEVLTHWANCRRVLNIYGPTETTVNATAFEVYKDTKKLYIGKPIANTQAYIVDGDQLCGVGVLGELCIAGESVGIGYLNSPELTKEKFVENPFGEGKLYHTGDLVCWTADGNIDFMGRIDEQVKVRGFRIELEDIANVIRRSDQVTDVAVIIRETKHGDKEICAYIVSEDEINIKDLQEMIAKELPSYMLPAYMMQIDQLPVTQNGKLDKKALPDISGARLESYVAPVTDSEKALCKIYEELLDIDKVGSNDSFFDLGGHSLKATYLKNMIDERLGKTIELKDIFHHPIIHQLAEILDGIESNEVREIRRTREQKWYETSPAQKRMYISQSMDKKTIAYNIPIILKVHREVERERLSQAFFSLIRRHETLRTTFFEQEDTIFQKIYPIEEITFTLEEIHVKSKEELERKFVEFVKPFDLTGDIPIRGQLVRMGDMTYLFLDVHHINSDAASSSIIQNELCLFYEGNNLGNLEVQYKDYIVWEEKKEGNQKKKAAQAYWLDQFTGELHLESLPTDYRRSKRNDFVGKEYVVCLEEDTLLRLRDICKNQNVTLFSLMMSAYSLLLGRLLNSCDVTVGIPVNNRNHSKLELMVGMFLNTIALRVKIREEESFAKFMDYMNLQIINGMSNQSFQFEELIDQLKIPRESNRTPLFDTIMNYVSDAVVGTKYREGSIQLVEDDSGLVQAKYDITWYINDFGDKLEVRCNYKTGLFKESTIAYIVEQYISILNQVAWDCNKPVGKLHFFERSQVRQKNPVQITKPHEPYVFGEGISLVSCLEEVAKRYKDCKALLMDGDILTYDQLRKKTDILSAQLRRAGIRMGDKVSLLCGHNGSMILAMMGVLKAGGTFVPLQADYPKERLSYIIQDTDSKILLVDKENCTIAKELQNMLSNLQVFEITGESTGENIEENTFSQDELVSTERLNDDKQIAYIMYTSGSTGNPKGVIQSCDSIMTFMADYINELKLDSSDRMILVSACNHATGIIDIFSTLLSGGCLYPYDMKKDTGIKGLLKVINEEHITIFHAVPSVYRYLIKDKEVSKKTNLRVIVLGGESLLKTDVENYRKHFNNDCYFINLFGSSEVLIATSYVMDKQTELIGDTVPIGYTVPQVESYIIEDNRVKGVYGTGEIVYQSDYLARGYYNMEEQTKKSFRINPVTRKGTVYYSGDLGKIMPDGRLVYMGRRDNQIKIRGYRIEMDEIGAVMNQVSDISQGVVKVYQRDNGENYLVGYYIGVGETEELEQKVRNALREKLPDYMMPSCFLRLEKMPLTSNSKVDLKALPKVEFIQSDTIMGGLPTDETEQIICDLYQQVLDIDTVGIHDNFFDLGGHSLKAMVLKNKLYESFGKTVELRDIFEYPSVVALARRMEQLEIQQEDDIKPIPEQAYYKTSSAQKRMYAAQSMDIMSITYNNPVIFEIHGKAQADKLEQACRLLQERHETLRTTFVEKDGGVFQIVHKAEDVSFALVVKEASGEDVEVQLFEEFVKPFNLTMEIPFRVWLVQNEDKQKLFLDVHHINCDVTSIMLLMKELGLLYNQKTLQPLNIQYRDYANWEQNNRTSKRFEKAKNYWLNQFDGYQTTADLPTDYRRLVETDNAGEELTVSITKGLLKKLRSRCSEDKVTLFAFMLAAYNVMLSRMTGSKDVIVGIPLNNRERKELEVISGMFLNTLAIREQVNYTDQFTTLLSGINKKISDGMENQSYQFEDLIEVLNLVRVKNRTPLFDTVMNFVNDATMDREKVEKGIYFIEDSTPVVRAKYDITWYVYDFGDRVELTCNYKSSLFKKTTMEYILKEYIQLLEQLAMNSHKVISQYSMFEKKVVDGKRILVIIAKDHVPLGRTEGVGLVQALENVVVANSEKPALKMDQDTLTYAVMNERANAIAFAIAKNTKVGLLCGHNSCMILAMIGVLKAGGTFVPLDADYPKERLLYILEDTDVDCLIIDHENKALGLQLQEGIPELHVYIVGKEQVVSNPNIQVPGDCPAYIMYTSGSTGRPKGVIQTYDNILTFMIGYINELKLDNKDKMLLVSACNHATGIIDTFSTLLSGGCLYPYDIKKGSGVKGLLSLVQKEEFTVFHSVPSVYRYMIREKSIEDKTTLRVIVLGGESLQKMDVENYRRHFDKECYLVNLFGSSEVLIATSYIMDIDTELAGETVPIGYLVPEVACHIIGEDGGEQGIYGAGEIVYESKYLSKGYFNMQEQTNKVFKLGDDGCLLYYSGDLGMLMPDGRLEYLGRKDHQIKIRGYRIELDEIEAVMNQVVGVGQAVVKAYQMKDGEYYLAAYYTKDTEETNNVEQDLRQVIKEQLPSYMTPACFIEIASMPITSNAKVDYQALEEPDITATLTTELEKPTTPMEEKLCYLYEEVLEVNIVGRGDSFFDLGGHSLRAMTLKNRIAEVMKKEVSLKEIFSRPTVAELAMLLEEKDAKENVIKKSENKERYEVSRAQLRTYVAHRLHNNGVAYNIPVVLKPSKNVDSKRLEGAFNKLIKRHETLRTVFIEEKGKVYQVIKDASEVPFVLAEITVDNEEERKYAFKEFVRPFDLTHEICLRAVLVNYKNSQELFLDLHHINGDASSVVILQQELISLYEGKELEPLSIQYKDYAVWENNYKSESAYKEAEDYWCNQFRGELKVHELPLDYKRSNVEDMVGGEYVVTIEGDLLVHLRNTCKTNKVTMFSVVLAAYDMLLSKLMNSTDVIVGIPVNNREQTALEQMIGQFLNTIAIKTMITSEESFEKLLQKVNEAIIEGMNYQYYSFEDLLEILHINRESGRTPLFDTVMNYVSQTKKPENGEFSMELMKSEETSAKYDMTWYVYDFGDQLEITCNYKLNLFKESTISYITSQFRNLLEQIGQNDKLMVNQYTVFEVSDKIGTNPVVIQKEHTPLQSNGLGLIRCLEQRVDEFKNLPALKMNSEIITYEEMNERANAIAKKIDKGHRVGILCGHNSNMIIAMLGVLKASATFVPLDVMYPVDRLSYILSDTQTRYLLVETECMSHPLIEKAGDKIEVIEIGVDRYKENPSKKTDKEQAAYIMYTSGSTGKPKGVIQTYENILEFMTCYINDLKLDEKDRMLLVSACNHATGIIDIFSTLLSGGCLYPYDIKKGTGVKGIVQILREEKITIFHAVPSVYRYMIREKEEQEKQEKMDLRVIVLGGESLQKSDVISYHNNFRSDCYLVNLLGSSEVLIATSYVMDQQTRLDGETVPVGYPVANVSCFIAGEDKERKEIYGIGEILYESRYLAKGYWNDEVQTNAAFGVNPVTESERVYYSGDLGMLKPDGSLEYLGRKDNQVKIRGYRIELDEIEVVMDSLIEVRQSVIKVYRRPNGENYLVAYYTAEDGYEDLKLALVKVIKEKLPSYMMPACFVKLDSMPLTGNAKVDRQALKEPELLEVNSEDHQEPMGELEAEICRLYQQVLDINMVGRKSSFFDLGGHSLKAMLLKNKIRESLGKNMELRDILLNPTPADLAKILEQAEENPEDLVDITPLEDKDYYETSAAQQRMYLTQSKDKESTAYNIPLILDIRGNVQQKRLEDSFEELIKRHETLRTNFVEERGKIMQIVRKPEEVGFLLETKTADSLEELFSIEEQFVRPFDLAKDCLLRAKLVTCKDEKKLLLDMHHIISDVTSMGILQKELIFLYDKIPVAELQVQYKDYAAWEKKNRFSKKGQEARQYWLDLYEEEVKTGELPTDYKRSQKPQQQGSEYVVNLMGDELKALRNLGKKQEVTLFAVMLSAYDFLLHRFLHSNDVIVGIPVNNRNRPELESMIGMFLNTIVLRTRIDRLENFNDLLQRVNKAILNGMNNQSYQFEDLVEELKLPIESNRTPLFDTVVNYVSQNKNQEYDNGESFTFELNKGKDTKAKYDMTWYLYDFGERLEITCNYKTDLFKETTIAYLTEQYIGLLSQIATTPNQPVDSYEIFAIKPERMLRNPVEIPKQHMPFVINQGKGLIEHIEQIAEVYGQHLAFKEKDKVITYEEMDQCANAIGYDLQQQGVSTGSTVALLCGHNSEMILAMIGVLKVGGIFVPLDASYPTERLQYILCDTKAKVLLVDDSNKAMGEVIQKEIKNMVLYQPKGSRRKETLEHKGGKDDTSYIMYTSGSTGKPKGVIQTCDNILAYMADYINELKLDATDRMALVSACNHATGIIDIFSTLLSGGCIYPYDIKKETGIKGLLLLIKEENITVYHSVPSVYRYMIKEKDETDKTDIRVIVLGGEKLEKEDIMKYQRHFRDDCCIINLFGSSEVLIATSYIIDKQTCIHGETVPIGYPVPNVTCYMVSDDKEIMGIFGEGEIVYESKYLARGYLNCQEHSKKVFGKGHIHNHGYTYFSGDLGRIMPDGKLEYLGRKDNQIKIRGYRIELDEIEAVMNLVEGIGQGVIKAYKKDDKESYLVAYYTKEHDNIVSLKERIQKAIKETLPNYMMPACFIELDVMPLSSNAKVDKSALQEPDLSALLEEDRVEAQTQDQHLLCKMFEEVLLVTNVGIKDSFFDLGGHSLKAMELKNKISEQLNKNIELKEIFDYPTVEELSNLLDQKEIEETAAIIALKEQEYYEVSSAQKRMYLAQIVEEDSTAYNNPKIYEIKGNVDKEDITQIYLKLLKRHEALRTGFEVQEEQIKQKVYKVENINFNVEEYTCNKEEEISSIIKQFVRPFNLKNPPLIRVGILKVGNERNMLLYDIHHIITDGTSFQILNRDLVSTYKEEELVSLPVTYKDYAVWENKREASETFKRHEEYWLSEFVQEIPKVSWPYYNSHPKDREAIYDQIVIERKQFEELNQLAKETGTTLFMILLGSLSVTIAKISGQDNLIIGSAEAGRNNSQIENVIGVFINDFAIKTRVIDGNTFREYLRQVKDKVMNGYEHQEYPYDKLIEILKNNKKISGSDLFNVMLVLENIKGQDVKTEGFALEPYNHIRTEAKYDLYVGGIQYEEEIVLGIEFCAGVFDEKARTSFKKHWERVLADICKNADQKIKTMDCDVIQQPEKMNEILEESNFDADFDF